MRPPGEGQFRVQHLRDRSVVTHLHNRSPLRLFAPRAATEPVPWLIATSLGGGLVDGDSLSLDGTLDADTTLYLGTQSVTKVYPGAARQHAKLTIADGALLAMISDPVMCFADASYEQTLSFALQQNASLLLVDGLLAGRVHYRQGEAWQFARYESRVTIERDGAPLLLDSVRLSRDDGDLATRFARFTATATVLAIGPRVAARGAAWRELARQNRRDGSLLVAHGEPSPGAHLLRVAAATHEELMRAIRGWLDLDGLIGEDPHRRRY